MLAIAFPVLGDAVAGDQLFLVAQGKLIVQVLFKKCSVLGASNAVLQHVHSVRQRKELGGTYTGICGTRKGLFHSTVADRSTASETQRNSKKGSSNLLQHFLFFSFFFFFLLGGNVHQNLYCTARKCFHANNAELAN